jgi:hypothetical protein
MGLSHEHENYFSHFALRYPAFVHKVIFKILQEMAAELFKNTGSIPIRLRAVVRGVRGL